MLMFIMLPILIGMLTLVGGIMFIHYSILAWSDGERGPESPYLVAFGAIFILTGLVMILGVLGAI